MKRSSRALRSLPPRAMALSLVLLARFTRFARSQHSVLQPWLRGPIYIPSKIKHFLMRILVYINI